jgi:thiamine-monophosphate kinase
MAQSEFDLISRYFKRPVAADMLGVGDDCALFTVAPGNQVATSMDLLLEHRHFFSDVDPARLGHKSLAVNLSDLAAMGAKPIACLLGLALPRIDDQWLQGFSDGFHALAKQALCPLIGGDTTRSQHDVAISVTVFGAVNPDVALKRSAGEPGDDVWVSGVFGAPDIAYRMLAGLIPRDESVLRDTRAALELPSPRLELGRAIAGHAHAAIDVSDGLLQDLGHILEESGVGARIDESLIPIHPAVVGLPRDVRRHAVLCGGDVYELCFTAALSEREKMMSISHRLGLPLTRIGELTAEPGLHLIDGRGQTVLPPAGGFDHFRDA